MVQEGFRAHEAELEIMCCGQVGNFSYVVRGVESFLIFVQHEQHLWDSVPLHHFPTWKLGAFKTSRCEILLSWEKS